MSFLGIWIIARDNKGESHVLFSRKYATVGRRFQLIHGRNLGDDLLDDSKFVKSLFTKLEINRKTDEFIEEFDGCQVNKEDPVLKVDVNGTELWPIIVLQKFKLVFACLGLVENKDFDGKTPLVEIPVISIGYALLHNICEFLDISPASIVPIASQIEELGSLLKILMPFGTPTDHNLNNMKSFLTGKDIGWIPKYKLSAWRPLQHKAKNQLHLHIQEKVNAAIYNHPEKIVYKDMCCTYGTISCKADIEGVPEVKVNLVSKANVHVVFHPCLQSIDFTTGRSGSVGNSSPEFYSSVEQVPVSRNVRFTPPHEQFPLCHFNCDSQLPVKGMYQLKVKTEVTQLQIHLQLSDEVKNAFEYFEVHIPFFHSGPITKLDYVNNWGTVLISPEKRRLVWSLGQKFPKTLQISLNATVLLGDPALAAEKSNFSEDPFCQGLNTYIQLFFKVANVTLSGIAVDPKSVQINPNSHAKIHIAKELVSSDYKIWNVHGDAIVAFPPTI